MIPAEADAAEPRLFKKNILEDIGGIINLDEELENEVSPETLNQAPAEEPENALIDVIDVGLDFAEDFLKGAGYPPLKRDIWEQRGKRAMNKALNAYLPAESPLGGALDAPAVALVIGVASLLFCLSPVLLHYMKQKEIKEAEERAAALAVTAPERRPEPEAEILEDDGDRDKQPAPETIAAILQANHPQFNET